MHSARSFAARVCLSSALICVLMLYAAPAVGAAEPETEAELVVATAKAQIGDQWQHRARGPNRFDCSGLVWYAFYENQLQSRIGYYRSVAGYFRWFKEQGRVGRTNPRLGDLVVWGDNQHIGIYIGDGKAISTLTTKRGVTIHDVKGYLGIPFKAYLRTQITRPKT
jgi:cell wall-associated NlpC family hydrolase